ncbi:MAG: peptidoglycan DD-metalloendopeptidase family protein [Clostridia bacterium]|nr:peptidoglycan DD-metalloendopeptidase family protein [Clostridia bacterium]
MKQKLFKIISVFMIAVCVCGTYVASAPAVSAASASEIQAEIDRLEKESAALKAEINKLKNDIKNQQKLKSTIESRMAVVQKKIDACNNQIAAINKQIDINKAAIEANNKQIEKDKELFKRRLRAIQMSNTGSNIQILLGAKSFSEFLQLSQLTASVSAKDKKMMEDIVKEIKRLNEKIKENEKLLEEQSAIKAEIAKDQAALQADANEIQKVINSINKDKNEVQADKNAVDKELQQMENALNEILYGSSGGNFVNNGKFLWPTTFKRISSYYGKRWGKMHNGVDISNGTYGQPIYAMADGKVYQYYNSCKHNYGKKPLKTCCGNGYGNYVAIDHGTYTGNSYAKANYKAYYAHMGSVIVKNGAYVKKGQIIGYVGSTGRSTGPHLHFGIMKNNAWVNPMNYF